MGPDGAGTGGTRKIPLQFGPFASQPPPWMSQGVPFADPCQGDATHPDGDCQMYRCRHPLASQYLSVVAFPTIAMSSSMPFRSTSVYMIEPVPMTTLPCCRARFHSR